MTIVNRLLYADHTPSEVISGSSLIAWGLVVMFGQLEALDTYILMLEIAPPDAWGTMALVLGITQLLGVFYAELGKRALVCIMAISLWCTIAVVTVTAATYSPAPWVYLIVGAANGWAVAQIPCKQRSDQLWQSLISSSQVRYLRH